MERLTDELLDLLGNEYRKMIEQTGIKPEDAPFYLMVERYLHIRKTYRF